MPNEALFKPLTVGAIQTRNRVFMAPLTRNRARPDGVPGELAAEYYAQRAGAGLIISEATQVSPRAKGYINTPGIHSDAQQAAWSRIVGGVHERGGKIALQLWHVGRISHVDLLPDGDKPLAPSAIRAKAQTVTSEGMIDVSEPEAMTTKQIRQTVQDFADGARRARAAGFDLVEIHGANGYLIDQFLRDGSNKRDDAYGGSIENRSRFLIEIVDAVSDAVGADRVGLRLSPTGAFNDMHDSDPKALFTYIAKTLSDRGLAYLHVVEDFGPAADGDDPKAVLEAVSRAWDGVYIGNGGYEADRAANAVRGGHANAIAFGRAYLANPDLADRLARGAPLNTPRPETFYGGGREGYTDYPLLEAAE
ncbi:alkene reductase [Maricaulis sp. CAU 1757]